MKILYIGPDSGTSRHRFHALGRLGHEVRLVDPFIPLRKAPKLMSWGFKTGYLGLERTITIHVARSVEDERFDVVWVDNGETVGPRLARFLKARGDRLVIHNLDNPFSGRDGSRWRLLRRSLPLYDLFVTPRASTRDDALRSGALRSLSVMFSSDEKVHRPVELNEQEKREFGSDVAFVGTWMPERGPFLSRLVERGVPLRIFGPRWSKAPEYRRLERLVRNCELDDEDYVKAISGAKVAIGLLSVGNRDFHTTRSMEIPAIGTLFCAPRTSDHQSLYDEGQEAVFFSGPDDCAELCLALLADDGRRQAIGRAGHARALANRWFNERVCNDILDIL